MHIVIFTNLIPHCYNSLYSLIDYHIMQGYSQCKVRLWVTRQTNKLLREAIPHTRNLQTTVSVYQSPSMSSDV